ncbi:hypothetical protein Tco_0392803 [Tanacetum coccineum]
MVKWIGRLSRLTPLPSREQRHPFLRYQGLEYTDADIIDFEERIYSREIHRVQVVDFKRMHELMWDGLFARMVMENCDDAGVVVFSSQAWGRLFDTRGPLVRELILEFLNMPYFALWLNMAPLPPREQRHPFLRYQGLEYIDSDIVAFGERLERIYMMEHCDDVGVVVFSSRAWGRLFDTRGTLVWDLILEFLSTLRFGEILLDLDAPDTI